MFRLKKFIKRGWTVTAGEMLKIAWDINALDLQNIAVLQDQLVGVDYVYFSNMVSRLQTRGEAGNGPYDRDYLMDLIDEMRGASSPMRLAMSCSAAVKASSVS